MTDSNKNTENIDDFRLPCKAIVVFSASALVFYEKTYDKQCKRSGQDIKNIFCYDKAKLIDE